MGVFDNIVYEIKTILSEDESLQDIILTDIYATAKKPNPINNIYVGLGLNGISVSNRALGEYLGIRNGDEVFGKSGDVSLKMRIYCPTELGGESNCEVFSRLCDSLFSSNIKNEITSVTCLETKFDYSLGAFILDCDIKLNIFIGTVSDDTPVNNIIVKGVI